MTTFSSDIRSDSLPDLRRIFESPQFRQAIPKIFQLKLVLDASVVLADLRWLEVHRRDKTARSKLQEVLDAETVVAYAPTFLCREVEQKLPLLARKYDLQLSSMKSHWLRYKKCITFIEKGGADHRYGDPHDAPYIKVQNSLNIPILTKDGDFVRMGGQVVDRQIVVRLCAYSRVSAVEYSLKISGVSAALLAVLGAQGLSRGVQIAIYNLRHLPPALQACLVAAIGIAIINPTSRGWLLETYQSTLDLAKSAGVAALQSMAPIAEQHESARQDSASMLLGIHAMLDASKLNGFAFKEG